MTEVLVGASLHLEQFSRELRATQTNSTLQRVDRLYIWCGRRRASVAGAPGFTLTVTYVIELAGAGDPGRRQELAAKNGVTYSSDWITGPMSRYNL